MNGRDRDSGSDGGDHFLGDYAWEFTPHWTVFTITRSGDGYALKGYDGTEFGEFVLTNDALAGKMCGGPARLSRESRSDRYLLSGEAQVTTRAGARTVPATTTLVKRVPPPSQALERPFGIHAEALVRHVRQSEQWIHQIKSLHFAADTTWTRTPEGIAHHRKELQARFPDTDFSQEKFWGLCPFEETKEEIHFDCRRFRHSRRSDREDTIEIWDGQTYTTYIKYHTHDQESYTIAPDFGEGGGLWLAGFTWPRLAQRHKFWWMGNTPAELDENDRFGRAEDFLLVGKQDYRGVPCYVLECRLKYADVLRWFVGVEDGLLRGSLSYDSEVKHERWTDQYRQVWPGGWFPMRQGYKIFLNDDTLRTFVQGWRDIEVTQIGVDEGFPAELFRMEFKEGVRVVDQRFGGPVTYRYKKDMTEQDWEQIRAQARRRAERDSADKRRLDARIDHEAPAFPSQCQWLNTAPLTWHDLRGKAVVLQFWSCSCGPCHNHIARLQPPAERGEIVLIGLHNPQTDIDEIKEIMAKYKADGPVCVDLPAERPAEGFGLLSSQYGVRAIPWWFVVGPDGKVVGHAMYPDRAFQIAREALRGQD
jgi:thiol-disulfide isomerase/thioredoxin